MESPIVSSRRSDSSRSNGKSPPPRTFAARNSTILIANRSQGLIVSEAECSRIRTGSPPRIRSRAKNDFPGENHMISCPSIVIGQGEKIYPSGFDIFSIPGEISAGGFTVDIALQESSVAAAARAGQA